MHKSEYTIRGNQQQFHKLSYYPADVYPWIITESYNAGTSWCPDIRERLIGVYRTKRDATRRRKQLAND